MHEMLLMQFFSNAIQKLQLNSKTDFLRIDVN
jgi:hypothetical protein